MYPLPAPSSLMPEIQPRHLTLFKKFVNTLNNYEKIGNLVCVH